MASRIDSKSDDCHCKDQPVGPDPDLQGKAIARIPQGYDAKINVRLVPGRDFKLEPVIRGCRPRKGAPRRDAKPTPLPPSLVDKLRDGDKKMVAWLAQDTGNAKLFLMRPTEALAKAGVELSRSEMKMIDRAHGAVAEARVVAPGVKVTDVTATAFPNGRVGQIKPGSTPDEPDDDGCEPKKKKKR